LMETVKVASLGQITDALFKVGGQYRRNMWEQTSNSVI
jgi:methylmalonyl-CoA mutase